MDVCTHRLENVGSVSQGRYQRAFDGLRRVIVAARVMGDFLLCQAPQPVDYRREGIGATHAHPSFAQLRQCCRNPTPSRLAAHVPRNVLLGGQVT